MNDSTVRKAEIVGQALSVEKCDEKNHFNQISSKRMDAFFTDGAIRRAEATGNVKSTLLQRRPEGLRALRAQLYGDRHATHVHVG